MEKNKMHQIVNETFHFLNNKGVGFVCYIWSKDGELGGGCQSTDADVVNALVVIGRLVKHFNIDPNTLSKILMDTELGMGEN